MNILITNDDGIYSPGIAALAKIAQRFGTVRIVAPDVEQSSMGHAITHSRPLSNCVALGLHMFPDTNVVLSGINMGPNLGNSMWHSGTLAAAKQAVLLGVKGIALSTPVGKTEPDFSAIDPFVEQTLQILLQNDDLRLYNVNFPPKPVDIKWTRQSVRLYDGQVVPGEDPMGRKHFWITVSPLEPADENTDRWAVEHDFVSITPLRLDLTNESELSGKLDIIEVNH
ncbi:MAG: 5'/3'-nucleotidase SurE [Pedobacter sp.]|nr:MAG: 5'/3'-nucleotidase SurE [Pedobacter sp.]